MEEKSEVKQVWDALKDSERDIKVLMNYQQAWLALKHLAKINVDDKLYSEMTRLEANLGI